MQASQARFLDELRDRRVVHYSQSDLDAAVDGSTWRPVGDSGRLFDRKHSENDVTPIVAAALALWQYDALPPAAPVKSVVVT